MQAALRQKRQPAHEAKHHGPPAVQPRPFCKLPKNDVGRDALAELTEIAEEGNLDVLHVFQLWDQGQRAGRSPNLAPIHIRQNLACVVKGPGSCMKRFQALNRRLRC